MAKDALAPAKGGNFGYRKDQARFIVSEHERDKRGVGPNRLLNQSEIEAAVGTDREVGHLITALLQKLAELQSGRMLDRAGNNMALLRLGQQRALHRGVNAFGSATRKYDFARLGVQQAGKAGPGGVHLVSELMAKGISAGRVAPIPR